MILGDRNVYLVRTPRFSAWKVEEVVMKEPVGTVPVEHSGGTGLRIGDYKVTYMFRMGSEAKQFVQMAAGDET